MGIALLVIAGLLLGGVISFARHRRWVATGVIAAADVIAFAGAYFWLAT